MKGVGSTRRGVDVNEDARGGISHTQHEERLLKFTHKKCKYVCENY